MPDDLTSDGVAAADLLDAHVQHAGVALVVALDASLETVAERTFVAHSLIASDHETSTATRVSRIEPWATGYETAAGG